MKKIILISGKARHGKDTVADILMDCLDGKITKISVAYYLKDIAKRFFGWDGNKDEAGRNLMQHLGTNIIRETIDSNFHINRLCEDIKIIYDTYDYVVVPDVRFLNEISVPRNIFGDKIITIRVNRSNFKSNMTPEQLNHPSETELDGFDFDHIIHNDAKIEDIQRQIEDLIMSGVI